ncbi:MAG TPA: membrane protein insertase YidC [Nitrospiraceae bacterium]|jgi:YidC/Oxa1 family membrane protein insertase|nr:membrane protein insertase YidC [Nitrospiraceae bacterium]
MDKRVVIFLVLSLAIIVGFDFLIKQMGWLPEPPPAQDAAVPAPSSAERKPTPAPVTDKDSGSTSLNVPAKSSQKSGAPSSDILPPASEQTVTIETDLVRVGLSNRGGVIQSWELKRYHTAPPEKKPVQLVYQGGKFKGPLSITVANAEIDKTIREGLYGIEKDFTILDAAHPVGHVTMQFHDSATHLGVEKRLTFHHDSYVVDVSVDLEGVTEPYDVGLGTNFGIVEWGSGFIGVIGSAWRVDDKIEKETPEKELERKGTVQWVALHDKYFLSVLMPKQGTAALAKNEGEKIVSAGVRMAASGVASSVGLQLYAGPKEHDSLRSLNVGLEEMIDFGFFIFGSWTVVKSVAKPIFYVLRFIHEYTYNYGVTIILLTVGIKLLFAPLQYKSYKSMKMMRVIQPKIAAVQAKYKGDRDRLNKELMKLYKDQKVNPLGGFLPMILQMPVFVALFNVLYTTIDLRQAPFMLWITDLSVQDPYYVLPIIMGATMFIQQKITPTTMDPTQAKIMLVLPVGMTFLFVNFPAGLVLYWLTNNTLTISQQLLTDRFVFRNNKAFISAGAEQSGSPNA